jgi:hypothetical protein
VLLAVVQATALERIKERLLADPDAHALSPRLGEHLASIVADLRGVDWAGILLLSGLLLLLGLLEIRRRSLSRDLTRILDSEASTLVLLGSLAVMAARFHLAPGTFTLGDSPAHLERMWAASESLRGGHWPSWSFFDYAGYPFLQFYSPLFFVVGGAMANLAGSVEWTAKALLFLLQAGSAFPVYAWSRSLGAPRSASLVAGLGCVLSFQQTHTIVWTGALPVSLVFVLFPLLLLSVERLLLGRSVLWMLVAAGATAGLVLSHHGYAAYSLQLAAAYAVLRCLLPVGARPGPKRLVTVALSLAAGIAVCSGFLWPLLREADWVHVPNEVPLLLPAVPSLSYLKKLVLWSNAWSGWTAAYLGITLLGFALIGAVRAWRGAPDESPKATRAVALAALLALLCASRTERATNLILPFLAVLSGGAVTIARIRRLPRGTFLVLGLLLLDLGPTTIQSPYRTDLEFVRDGYRRVADAVSPHRVILGYRSSSGTHYFHWTAPWGTGLVVPTGTYPQGAPGSLAAITATVDALNRGPAPPRPERILDFLYLWDAGGLLTRTRERFVMPDVSAFAGVDRARAPRIVPSFAGGVPVARVEPASPLVFSDSLAVALDDSLRGEWSSDFLLHDTGDHPGRRAFLRRMGRWVAAMRLDPERGRAGVLWLAGEKGSEAIDADWILRHGPFSAVSLREAWDALGILEREENTERTTSGEASAVSVRSYSVTRRRVSIGYEAKRTGYLRLAFSWYPTLRALVDGEPVTPAPSLLGAVVIPTREGEHEIELLPGGDPVRRRSTWAGAALGLLFAALALAAGRKPPRPEAPSS